MKRNRTSLIVMAFALITVLFTACNKDVKVDGVTVNPKEATLNIGETLPIVPTVTPSDADDKSVKWSSDKPEIAEVNDNGTVTAKGAGIAIITCTTNDGNHKATTKVTVEGGVVAVTDVTVPANMTVGVGEVATITPTIAPANATNQMVTWTCDAPEIASVDSEGRVTGIAEGVAIVTCTTVDGNFTDNTTVTVVAEITDYAAIIEGKYVGPMSMGEEVVEEAAVIDVDYLAVNKVELKMNQTLNVGMEIPINIVCESDVVLVDGKYHIAAETTFELNPAMKFDVQVSGHFDNENNANIIIHVVDLNMDVVFEGKKQ